MVDHSVPAGRTGGQTGLVELQLRHSSGQASWLRVVSSLSMPAPATRSHGHRCPLGSRPGDESSLPPEPRHLAARSPLCRGATYHPPKSGALAEVVHRFHIDQPVCRVSRLASLAAPSSVAHPIDLVPGMAQRPECSDPVTGGCVASEVERGVDQHVSSDAPAPERAQLPRSRWQTDCRCGLRHCQRNRKRPNEPWEKLWTQPSVQPC